MPRRNRYSRRIYLALASLLVVGGVAGGYRRFGHAERHVAVADPTTKPAAVTPPVAPIAMAPIAPAPVTFIAPVVKAPPAGRRPVALLDLPTTRPAMAIAVARPSPTSPVDAPALFKDADARIAADDWLVARDLLVTALDGKKFSDTERDAAFDRLGKINDVVVFGPRKFVSDTHATAYTVTAGDNLQKIANKYDVTVGFLQRVNNISSPKKLRLGANLKVIKGPFHAVVNKTAFTLDLYQGRPDEAGAIFLKRLRVGLGEHDSTPTGLWKIGTKLPNPTYYNSRDTGPRVIPANDPTNPLGERWLALEGLQGQAVGKESYGIHGTIDPASIGQKKSMGCIRLLNEDVNLVYDMLIKDKSTVAVVE